MANSGKIILFVLAICFLPSALALNINSEHGIITIPDKQLKVGDSAPQMVLQDHNFKNENVGGATGRVQVLVSIESFFTFRDDAQTLALDKLATNKNIDYYVISSNQPFILDAFISNHNLQNIKLRSSFNNRPFSTAYGIEILNGPMRDILVRSIFVINQKGEIVYKQLLTNEDLVPALNPALAIAQQTAAKN